MDFREVSLSSELKLEADCHSVPYLTSKCRTFETVEPRAGRSLFKCPLLLCQFLLERFH
jgi:hypothetical protein